MDSGTGHGRHTRSVICEHTFYYVGLAALLVAAPFIILDVLDDHLATALLGAVLLALFTADVIGTRIHGRRLVQPAVLLVLASAALLVLLQVKGALVVYWAYPLVLGYHFILPRRHAIVLNVVLLAALALLLPGSAGWGEAVRVLATLALSSTFAYVFALLVDRQHDALEAQLITDPLTGAYNRRHMNLRLAEVVHRRKRHGHPASLILFDIDHFKRINDTNGHACGDRVLRILVDTVKARIRLTDEVYRYGGEEFVVLLQDTALEDAARLAQEITSMIADVRVIDAGRISISCGVGELLANEDAAGWLARCDAALYQAKDEGRGRVCLASVKPARAVGGAAAMDTPLSSSAG